MNNNLSQQALARKNKEQLLEMFQEALDFANEENTTDALYEAIEQIQSVAYILKNCEYEGRQD